MKKQLTWEKVKKDLNFSKEELAEIQLEKDLIEAVIQVRKKSQLTQRELSEKCGIKQPSIAKIESGARSPQVDTLMRMLLAMGYTLRVEPISKDG